MNFSYSKISSRDFIESSDFEKSSKGQYPSTYNIASMHNIRNPDFFGSLYEKSRDEDFWSEGSGKNAHNLPSMVASMFPSITAATVKMQAKTLKHVFETLDEIGESLKSYYVNETLGQIYKIIGSLDFVGNPSMALNSIMTGVRDFLFEPSMALLKSQHNPSELGLGVVRGALSLVSNSASGVFGFASKFSASFGQLAAVLSMDKKFQIKHKEDLIDYAHTKKQPGTKHIIFMTSRPIKDVGKGILRAATGVITEPYKGAKKNGVLGLAKGVGIGTIGIVAKPLVGIFDAFSHATDSINYIAQSVNILDKKDAPIQKRRLSYIFGINNILIPFDPVSARSVDLIRRLPVSSGGRGSIHKKRSDSLEEFLIIGELLSMDPETDLYIVLTSKRLVLFEIRTGNGVMNTSIRYIFAFNHRNNISSAIDKEGYSGVALCILERNRTIDFSHVKTPTEKHGSKMARSGSKSNLILKQGSKQLTNESGMMSEGLELGSGDGFTKRTAKHFFTHDPRKDHDDVDRYVQVFMGEFRHQPNLVRIHNAICCLSGEFDRVLHENFACTDGRDEGIFKFGNMRFQKNFTKQQPEHSSQKMSSSEAKQTNFYSTLNDAKWLAETGSKLIVLNHSTAITTENSRKDLKLFQESFLSEISPSYEVGHNSANSSLHKKAEEGIDIADNDGGSKLKNSSSGVGVALSSSGYSPLFDSFHLVHEKGDTDDIASSEQQSQSSALNDSATLSASEIRINSRLDKVELMLEKLLESQSQAMLSVSKNNAATTAAAGLPKFYSSRNTMLGSFSTLGDLGAEEIVIPEDEVIETAPSVPNNKNIKSDDVTEALLKEIDSLKREVGRLAQHNDHEEDNEKQKNDTNTEREDNLDQMKVQKKSSFFRRRKKHNGK